ncbi:hypothetical protein ACT7C4_13420 [Bacillus pacificus]
MKKRRIVTKKVEGKKAVELRLADFIELDKNEVIYFDFKNISPSFEVQKRITSCKKNILYKKDYQERILYGVKEKFDCDRCDLVLEIYSKIYANKNLNNLDLDTMNSFLSNVPAFIAIK